MNELEKEEQEEEENKEEVEEPLVLVSFDEYMTTIEAEKEEALDELKKLVVTDAEIQDVKDGIVFHLKQVKSNVEQLDFLTAFQDKYDLKEFITRGNNTLERVLIDFGIFQEMSFDTLKVIQKEDVTFFPETFDFIFTHPEKFEKWLVKKKRLKLLDFLRETKNTDLILPNKILDRERKKSIVQQDITTIKEELRKGDIRLKKIKKVAPDQKDVLDRFESQRIVQISMLIYYYYRLSNEDVEPDKGLSKVFPEIGEAQKKFDELAAKELKQKKEKKKTAAQKKTAKRKD